jgi:hypothetical protein
MLTAHDNAKVLFLVTVPEVWVLSGMEDVLGK